MTRYFSQTDSAQHYAAETAAAIDRSHEGLAEFRTWVAREVRIMGAAVEQTRIIMQESRELLARFSTQQPGIDPGKRAFQPPPGTSPISV